ncbi:MAG: DUF1566 domain-containing protein, partial [Thermodesulfobacteriota bacterium]
TPTPATPPASTSPTPMEKTHGRLIDNGDGTVTHEKAGLMWARKDSYAEEEECITWEGAGEYVEKMKTGGHDDWRLPTVEELGSIAAKSAWNWSAVFVNGDSRAVHWSSEEAGSCCARAVLFTSGIVTGPSRGACSTESVRAVRP